MKQIKFFLALVIAWMAGASVTRADISVSMNDGITLQLAITDADAKTCELVDILMPSKGGIDLPATVSYGGETYAVTSIAGRSTIVSRQFSGTLTSLVLPEGLLTIGQSAFFDCTELTTLTIPASVTSIGYGAFSGCAKLTDVTLKTRDYNTYAFSSYTNLSGRTYHNVFPASTEATFHVTEMFYLGIQQGLMAEGWTEFTDLYTADNVQFVTMAPEVGDMTIAQMDVIDASGNKVSTRNVIVTFTDVTEGQRKAIVYRPMRDELYNPATCWTKDAYGADEASYFGDDDPDYTNVEGTLVIPTNIKDLSGKDYTLTGIGGSGFYCNYDPAITGIRIPKTITQIGVRGLAGLQYLKGTLVIPSSVTQIGDPSVDKPHVFYEGQYYNWSDPSSSYYVERLYFMHRGNNIVWYDTDASKYFSDGREDFSSGKPDLYYFSSVVTMKPDASHSGFGTWRYGHTNYFDPTTSGIFFSEDQWSDPMTRFEAYESGEVSVTKLTNLFNLPVAFSTTDASVAQVKMENGQPVLDEEDNLVLIIGEKVGTAEIKATFAGDDYFDAGEAVLTVVHKGPAELGSQVNTNDKNTVQTLSGLTKITFGYDDLALREQYGDIYIEDEDDLQTWAAATIHDGKIYASAFAELSEYGYLSQSSSEGYYYGYSEYYESGYRLCYNPSELTPNWGADAWDGETFDPQPGTNCAGLLAFKVPAGEGTIIVKGYTDNENAKMAIRLGLADAEPMTMAGYDGGEWNPMPKEFTYQYNNDSGAGAWIYIFGVSLKPDDEHRGHIESITYLPKGVTIAKLSIAGTPVAEGSPYNSNNGISVTWAEGFGGIEGGDPEMGDEGGSSLMPVITLNNANLTYNNGPAIEVNSYSMVTINLVGNNTISSTKADCAAISFGTMNGNDWEGCGNVIIKPETDGSDVSLTVPAQSHATGVYNYSSSISLSSVIADFGGTDYGLYINPGNMSGGEGPMNPPLELNSSFLKLRGDESAYVFEGGNWQGYISVDILEALPEPTGEEAVYEYDYASGQFTCGEDVATYLWIGPKGEWVEAPIGWSTHPVNDWDIDIKVSGIDFSSVSQELLCYMVTGVDVENFTLTLTRVNGKLYDDDRYAVLLYNQTTNKTRFHIPYNDDVATYGENSENKLLKGTSNVQPTEGDNTNFVLTKKDGKYVFRPLRTARDLTGKGYLPIPTSALQSDGNGVKGFSIVLEDDDPTGISNIENLRVPASVVFDLLGRQQQNMQRQGIYIRDGKKIIVK